MGISPQSRRRRRGDSAAAKCASRLDRGDAYQRYDEPREGGFAEIRRLQPKCIFEMGSTTLATPFTKEIVLGLASAAASFFALWFWKEAVPSLTKEGLGNYAQFFIPILALIAAASLFALSAALLELQLVRGASSLAPLVLLFFTLPYSSAALTVLWVSAVLVVFSARRIRKEHVFSLGFSTSKVLKAGIPIYFTAVSLVVSLFYYLQLSEGEGALVTIFPRQAVELTIGVLSGAVTDLREIPEANSLLTVDEFLSQNLEGQLMAQGTSLETLPQKEAAELLAEQRNALAKRYGIPLKGGERLAEVLHRTITARVEELLGPYARFLPVISALTFFFAFKALTLPLYFITLVAVFLLIKALRAAKIVHSEVRQVEVDRLTL